MSRMQNLTAELEQEQAYVDVLYRRLDTLRERTQAELERALGADGGGNFQARVDRDALGPPRPAPGGPRPFRAPPQRAPGPAGRGRARPVLRPAGPGRRQPPVHRPPWAARRRTRTAAGRLARPRGPAALPGAL